MYAKNHASSMLYWQKFAPPGVDIAVTPVTSTAEILQALEGGALDFGLMSPYVPILTQAEGGHQLQGRRHGRPPGVRADRKKGEVASVADLRGKKITVPAPRCWCSASC